MLILFILNIKCFWTQTLTPQPILCTYIAPSTVNGNYSGVINATYCIQDHQNDPNKINISGNQNVELKAGKEIFLDGEVHVHPNQNGNFYAHINESQYEVAWFDPYNSLGSVPKNEKLEIGIKMPTSINEAISNFILENGQTPALNPFNPNHINITAFFITGNDTVQYDFQGEPYYAGETKTVYGFYYKEFERVTPQPEATLVNTWHWNGNINMVDQVNTEYNFRVRFAPTNLGIHHCRLAISINNQPFEQLGSFSFNVTNPIDHGFVEVSPTDNRFFERDGDFYFPAGRNIPGPECWYDANNDPHNCLAYEVVCHSNPAYCKNRNPKYQLSYFEQLQQYSDEGLKFFRYVNFESRMEIEFEKLNNYYDRQDCAWEIDRLLDFCKDVDLSMIFVLDHHASWTKTEGRYLWDFSPRDPNALGVDQYNCDVEDYGYCYSQIPGVNSPKDMLTNPIAIENYKHRLRYYISRYGYSNKIATFELVSEINNLESYMYNYESLERDYDPSLRYCTLNGSKKYSPYPGENSDNPDRTPFEKLDLDLPGLVYLWQNEMICYLKQSLDCNQLVGPSYAGYPNTGLNGNYQEKDEFGDIIINEFFAQDLTYFSGCVDYVSWNDYGTKTQFYFDEQNRLKSESPYINFNKPIVHSELGFSDALECDLGTEYYRRIWKGSFTGLGSVPMEWHHQYQYEKVNAYAKFESFMSGVDLRGDWETDSRKLSDKRTEILYYRSINQRKAIGVLDNLTVNYTTIGNCTYSGGLEDNQNQAFSIETYLHYISNMGFKIKYRIDYYNTYTGQLISSQEKRSNTIGRLLLEPPTLTNTINGSMIAFKIYRHNQTFINSPNINSNYESIEENTILPIDSFDTTAIYDKLIEQALSVFPVGNNNNIQIEVNSEIDYQLITIYSMDGKIVLESTMSNNNKILDISILSSGIYIIRTTNKNGDFLHVKYNK